MSEASACPDEELCGTVSRLFLCQSIAVTRRGSGHVHTMNVQCFNVRCTGSLDGEVTGACTGNTIKVKIIDA